MSDNAPLEQSMGPAAEGDESQARVFYTAFLRGPLYVPERFQTQALAGLAAYPDDFLNILALEDAERVVVPVFSHAQYALAWCGQELKQRCLTGPELIGLLQPTWWVCVNPGSEFEKELTPWELDTLRGGEKALDALVHELFSDDYREPVDVRQLQDGEHSNLLDALRTEARNHKSVSKVFALHETGKDFDENMVETILIGVACNPSDINRPLSELQHTFQNIADLHLIGGIRSRVFVGLDEEENLGLSVFRSFVPIYAQKAPETLVKKLLGLPLSTWFKASKPN